MKTKTRPRLIKKHQRDTSEHRETVKVSSDGDGCSTAVRSWVAEFRNRDQREYLPAFDSLFGPVVSETERGD